ncbi:MAG: hypothetical protein IJK04_11205, partial [Kiritimatiellae bacterium]|nr:hypothetical protein [Kiritimatiellia bacterium]
MRHEDWKYRLCPCGRTSRSTRRPQPPDYGTATLKTWLSDASNAYAYADDLAENGDFLGLNVVGNCFVYNAPSDTALSIGVEIVGCYTLSSNADDWTA